MSRSHSRFIDRISPYWFWAALHDWGHSTAAIVQFAPLALLEGYRIWYWYLRPRQPLHLSTA